MYLCNTHAKHLQELLEAREEECVRLRRQLKELKSTASLRQLLTHSKNSSDLGQILLGGFLPPCIVNFSLIISAVFQFSPPPSPLSRDHLHPRGRQQQQQQQQVVYWSVGREMRASSSRTSSQVRPKPLCVINITHVLRQLLHTCNLGSSSST